jgi:hypothetical protein
MSLCMSDLPSVSWELCILSGGRSCSFWNSVSWVQFPRLKMSRAKSNLIMIQNVEGNFPGPESTLNRLAICRRVTYMLKESVIGAEYIINT